MLELYYFAKGVIIGFIVSVPIGPVSLLCIRRSLSKGRVEGFVTGIGATLGDFLYASIAAFGLSFVIHFLRQEEFWLRLFGGAFLVFMGIFVIVKKTTYQIKEKQAETRHLGEALGSAFLLDISNPVIILAYLAIFSGFGLSPPNAHLFSALSLVIGVGAGAALWWSLLVQLVCLFRNKISDRGIFWISKVGASMLIFFGLFVIYSSFLAVPFFNGDF